MKNKLGLTDSLLLAVTMALLVIGAHQTYLVSKTEGFRMGFLKNYWIFMVVITLMIVYQIRKNKKAKAENSGDHPSGEISAKKKNKKPLKK